MHFGGDDDGLGRDRRCGDSIALKRLLRCHVAFRTLAAGAIPATVARTAFTGQLRACGFSGFIGRCDGCCCNDGFSAAALDVLNGFRHFSAFRTFSGAAVVTVAATTTAAAATTALTVLVAALGASGL